MSHATRRKVGCGVHAATGWLRELPITKFNLTDCRRPVDWPETAIYRPTLNYEPLFDRVLYYRCGRLFFFFVRVFLTLRSSQKARLARASDFFGQSV